MVTVRNATCNAPDTVLKDPLGMRIVGKSSPFEIFEMFADHFWIHILFVKSRMNSSLIVAERPIDILQAFPVAINPATRLASRLDFGSGDAQKGQTVLCVF